MATLNVTPCKGVISTGGQEAQIAGAIDTDSAVDIATDDTATALPTFRGQAADYYRIIPTAAMHIGLGASTIGAGHCKMYLASGVVEYIPRESATHIIKDDV